MEAPDRMESTDVAVVVVVAVLGGKQVTAVVTEVLGVGWGVSGREDDSGQEWSGRRQWSGVVGKTTVVRSG